MYYREQSPEEVRVPHAYDGVAFRDGGNDEYIEEIKPNRNPWEAEPEPKAPQAQSTAEPESAKTPKTESVFSTIRNLFPMGDALKGLNLPAFLGKFMSGSPKKKGGDDNREEENLMLLLVAAILFFSPKGDKKAALLLLLVYVLA